MGVAVIPLAAIPSQIVNVVLAGQACTIELRQLGGRQYLSLSVGGEVVCETVLVVNRSAIIRAKHAGFVGDLAAIDTEGDEPPAYTGWGSRWLLCFNDAA